MITAVVEHLPVAEVASYGWPGRGCTARGPTGRGGCVSGTASGPRGLTTWSGWQRELVASGDAGPEHSLHSARVRAVARILTRTAVPSEEKPKSATPLPGRAAERDLAVRLHPVRLADGTDVEVITWLDDHSRYALAPTPRSPAPMWSRLPGLVAGHGASR